MDHGLQSKRHENASNASNGTCNHLRLLGSLLWFFRGTSATEAEGPAGRSRPSRGLGLGGIAQSRLRLLLLLLILDSKDFVGLQLLCQVYHGSTEELHGFLKLRGAARPRFRVKVDQQGGSGKRCRATMKVLVDGVASPTLKPVVSAKLPVGTIEQGDLQLARTLLRQLVGKLQGIDVAPQLEDLFQLRAALCPSCGCLDETVVVVYTLGVDTHKTEMHSGFERC
mmetsp:Transcript_21904/g.51358  ORF Transcript_21904/g.51358 Transcript_21904/m.51358 type:complete len:225 (-) Transcript_21904:1186-1860(-)